MTIGGTPGGPRLATEPQAGATPMQEARRIAERLGSSRPGQWALAGESDGDWGNAWVCRIRPARIAHVLGSSTMAAELRRIFASGEVHGWSLQAMPEQMTPLHRYRDAILAAPPAPGRANTYNALERAGFAYAEEIAATPDEALRDVRNIGDTALRTIREILGGPPNPTTADLAAVPAPGAQPPTTAPAGSPGSDRIAAGRLDAAAARLREEASRLEREAADLRPATEPRVPPGIGDGAPRAWQVHGHRTAYNGEPWVRVELADLTAPDGQRFEHHVVRLSPVAVAMVIDTDTGQVLTLHRHRWAIDTWGHEFPGGIIDDGEDPAIAARRECREETGFDPIGDGEHCITATAIPGMVTGPVHIHLWRHGARQVGTPSDPHEPGTVEWLPLTRLRSLADAGGLLGAATLIGAYRYLTHHHASG